MKLLYLPLPLMEISKHQEMVVIHFLTRDCFGFTYFLVISINKNIFVVFKYRAFKVIPLLYKPSYFFNLCLQQFNITGRIYL